MLEVLVLSRNADGASLAQQAVNLCHRRRRSIVARRRQGRTTRRPLALLMPPLLLLLLLLAQLLLLLSLAPNVGPRLLELAPH